jgi:hypothetical protein
MLGISPHRSFNYLFQRSREIKQISVLPVSRSPNRIMRLMGCSQGFLLQGGKQGAIELDSGNNCVVRVGLVGFDKNLRNVKNSY